MYCSFAFYCYANYAAGNRHRWDGERRVNGSFIFGVGAVCAYAAIKKRKEDKSALVLGLCLAVLACVPGGWISGKVAADLIEGPKTIRLTSVTTEELNGLSGLISHHYYLCGRGEDGKQYRLEVSADEFYELENIHEIIVRCYSRTERILEFL